MSPRDVVVPGAAFQGQRVAVPRVNSNVCPTPARRICSAEDRLAVLYASPRSPHKHAAPQLPSDKPQRTATMQMDFAKAMRLLRLGVLTVAVSSSVSAFAQDTDDEDETGGLAAEKEAEEAAAPTAGPPPSATTPLPPPAAPPPAPPSPFSWAIKGFVSGTIAMQDVMGGAAGSYNTFLFAQNANPTTDKWMYGGDVRQSQLKFFITGPRVLGAVPLAGFDFDLLGGHQINSTPGLVAPITVWNPTTMMNTPTGANAATGTSAQGDENILPRVRLAYLELNWGEGQDILRVGQYHNLIVPMIAASLSHIGAPLGYGAGQLGWRAPGITYQHNFKLAEKTNLAASLQLNRNNWADNLPTCPTGTTTSPGNNCLPNGVSFGEASALPQVQARLMLSGPPKASPFPMYAPNAWQVHLVGVWDQKDASGFGVKPAAGSTYNDTLTTAVVAGGFKVSLGPVLLAGHGWYGKNAGSMFGHIFAMQHPQSGDISGFGGWAQIGYSLTPNLAVWAFGGIDKPNESDIRRAMRNYYIQNVQLVGMVSYVAGPVAFSLEYMRLMSDFAFARVPASAATMNRAIPERTASAQANQIALTGAFFF